MKKIAILGCENSHAKNFLTPIREGRYPDLEVVGVYSDDAAAAQALKDEFGVAVMERYDELAGQLDGLVVTARHGDNHLRYAAPYLKDGIPMFIDKPITCTEEDALTLIREAKANGVRLCGGSVCKLLDETRALRDAIGTDAIGEVRGGALACPISLDNPYGGFFFYSQHLVDIMTEIFGMEVRAVRADSTANGISATFRYDTFCVTGAYNDAVYYYSVSVFGDKGTDTRQLSITSECFAREMDEFVDLLRGGEMHDRYEDFLTPVHILCATHRALQSGAWEDVKPAALS